MDAYQARKLRKIVGYEMLKGEACPSNRHVTGLCERKKPTKICRAIPSMGFILALNGCDHFMLTACVGEGWVKVRVHVHRDFHFDTCRAGRCKGYRGHRLQV